MYRLISLLVMVTLCSMQASASENGADAALDMLEEALNAAKVDAAVAIAEFKRHDQNRFRRGNIYVFCFNATDGQVATGQTAGTDIRSFKSSDGVPVGAAMFDAVQGRPGITMVYRYMAPLPGPDKTPRPKLTFIRREGDLACGTGYYR